MTHPYQDFVRRFAQLMDAGRTLPLGDLLPNIPTKPPVGGPVVMVFAPHPDDESIVGALPLRMLREANHRILVVAVTQGSRVDRQQARLQEMRAACGFLGFELLTIRENGLAGIHPRTREQNAPAWSASVSLISSMLSDHSPSTIFIPHEKDMNTTHQGTHLLVLDALRALGTDVSCNVVETEFWAPMAEPNLMVESSCEEVADLVAALSFHKGEVERNPYHLRLPAWMSDNVRRGSELVGGQGAASPEFHFATLYRLRRWDGNHLIPRIHEGRILPAGSGLDALFG